MMDSANIGEKKKTIMNYVNTLDRHYLVLDLTKLDYINSESIGLLFEISDILENSEKKLVLVGSKPNVDDVFKVIGLYEVVPHYNDLAAFLGDFHKNNAEALKKFGFKK
jgi:anti-anti-sigma factor